MKRSTAITPMMSLEAAQVSGRVMMVKV